MALEDSAQYVVFPRLVGPYSTPTGVQIEVLDQSMENNLGRLTATKTLRVAGKKHPSAAMDAALSYCGGIGAPYQEESASATPEATLVVVGAAVVGRSSEVVFDVRVNFDDQRAVESLTYDSTGFGLKSFGYDFGGEQITIQRAEENIMRYNAANAAGVAAGRIVGVEDGGYKGASVLVPTMTYWELWKMPNLSGDFVQNVGGTLSYGQKFEDYYEYYGIPAFDYGAPEAQMLGDDYVPGLMDLIRYGSDPPDTRGKTNYDTYYVGGREVIRRAGYDPDTTDAYATLSYAQYLAGFVGCVNAPNFHVNYHAISAEWDGSTWGFTKLSSIGRSPLGARHTWRGFPPGTLRMDAPEVKQAGNNAWTVLFKFAYQPTWSYKLEDEDYIIWANGVALPRAGSTLEKVGHQFVFWDTQDQTDKAAPSRINSISVAKMYPEVDFSLLGIGWVAPIFGEPKVIT